MIKQCSIHGLLTSMLLIVFSLMSNDAIAQKAIEVQSSMKQMNPLSVPVSLLKVQQMVLLQELMEPSM